MFGGGFTDLEGELEISVQGSLPLLDGISNGRKWK
jgi:hypothetical protein